MMLRITRTMLPLFLCLSGYIQAQENAPERYLEVRGVSELEMEPLARATANLYEGSTRIKSVQTGADGSFSFKLEANKQYIIEIQKDGLISKRISFNTQMPDDEKGTWMNEFSMGLIKPCSGVDYSVLNEPVDKVSFDAKRREFISDKDYVNRTRPKIESLMIRNDQCMLNTYESLVKKGDQMAGQKSFQEALAAYREALNVYPDEEYPAKRIAEINAQINKQQFSAEAYQKVIAEADALSSQQKFNEALQKYKQAAALNPQETYPRQKVNEIETSLAQQQTAKQALLNTEDRYNQAMAKASVAFTRKDYAVAKQYYQEALEIKPSASLPKTRVQEIETIQAKKASEDAARTAEMTKKAVAEKEYTSLVQQADELYKAKKFEEAKAVYAKAINMKPAESYPAQRIKVIDNAVASEQANLQKSKDNGYSAAMTAANNALAKDQYPLARESLQQALSFKPDDLAAKSRLAEVDRLEGDYTKNRALNEQHKGLIQDADALLAKKEWNKAKESYLQALALKPGDPYAQSRIKAIDNTVAGEQAALLKTRNEGYNAALSAGNIALAEEQFSLAKESFQKALSIKPDDPVAKSKLSETNRLAEDFAKRRSVDEQVQKLIKAADDLFTARDLMKARETYVQALSLKPGDPYAQTKITAIDNTIAAEKAVKLQATEDGYKAAVGAANTAITQKAYTQAKIFLQKALVIKPGDVYATGRAVEVERLITDQQKKLEQEKLLASQYNELISTADKSFTGREFTSAKASYNRALQIKPGDPYASQKIVSIDNILAAETAGKQKKLEEDYSGAMGRGTSALIAKDYKSARDAFQQALALKPGDNNAKSRLSETELLIKQEQDRVVAEQTRKKRYDETIRTADQLLAQKNYTGAASSYEQALEIMPGEAYPRLKREEITKAVSEQERLLAESKAREASYNMALANADKYYKAKDYAQAKDEYNRALLLRPDEVFPRTRLTEMENLIRIRQQEQEQARTKATAYSAAMNAGNSAFSSKNYPAARNAYSEALKYMPGDLLATEQIKKIDYLLAEAEKVKQAEQERKAAYDALIASADKSFETANYPAARETYKKALTIEPNSAYAKQRVARIDEIIRALAQTSVKTTTQNTPVASKVSAAIVMRELNFKNESEKQIYLDELKRKYPSGITLEIYKERNKETYRYIIIREDQVQEFRHIKYLTYSGAQYSVNGKPITQQYFLSQVKTREGESYKEIDMQ